MNQPDDWNPYAGSLGRSFGESQQISSAPRTIGLLNIIFGIPLLMCGMCYGINLLFQSMMGPMLVPQQQQMQQAMEDARDESLKKLEAAREEAKTDAEAAKLQAEHDRLAQQPLPVLPDLSKMAGMNSPLVLSAFIFDAATALILNLLMIVAGVGLLSYRAWGRKLGVWVAGLKVARLVIVCVLTLAVIAPAVSRGMGDMMQEFAKLNPKAPPTPAGAVQQLYSWFFTVWAFLLLILGSIYPLISLWQLKRREVIRDCGGEVLLEERDPF